MLVFIVVVFFNIENFYDGEIKFGYFGRMLKGMMCFIGWLCFLVFFEEEGEDGVGVGMWGLYLCLMFF